MLDWINDLPVALSGNMVIEGPNTPVRLYEGLLRISREHKLLLEEVGQVELSWFPYPALRFQVGSQGTIDMLSIFDGEFSVELVEAKMLLKALGTSLDSDFFIGVITGEVESSSSDEMQYVTFYIPNFINFVGEAIRDSEKANMRMRKMSLAVKDWQIVIEALPNDQSTYDALRKQGGYAITHVGRIQKKSNESVTLEETKLMCDKLHECLSFCRGAFCGPLLLSGYNADRAMVWKNWSIPRIQAWKSENTWFPVHRVVQAKQVIQSYVLVTQNNKWHEVLRPAIYWLVEAHIASTEEIGIVNAQIGIELLAWAKFVEIDQALSRDGFNKLTAIDRIQLLLFWANIPADIPLELKHLTAVADNRKKIKGASEWRNGPTAIIELRNSIAHPNLRDRTADVTGEAKYEVRQLAIWYLELLILRFLNYQGEYHNRLEHKWAAKTEFLPWLTETQN